MVTILAQKFVKYLLDNDMRFLASLAATSVLAMFYFFTVRNEKYKSGVLSMAPCSVSGACPRLQQEKDMTGIFLVLRSLELI